MRGKRGQFYLVAILIIITMFIGLLATTNSIRTEKNVKIEDINRELTIEKSAILDYLANNDSTDLYSKNILENFSLSYIDKIGTNKNIIFLIGKKNDSKLIGNSLNDSELSYNIGSGYVDITDEGAFTKDIVPTTTDINISIDNINYTFNLQDGQNIYYIIKHEYNNEVHIVYG